MYLQRIELQHIKMFKNFVWELPKGTEPAGWHVLLGDNGSGKSTVLRAAALALMGEEIIAPLSYKVELDRYISDDADRTAAFVEARITPHKATTFEDKFRGVGNTSDKPIMLKIIGSLQSTGFEAGSGQRVKTAQRGIWSDAQGWFSASFGPFRRFTGGDKDYERHFVKTPRLARHLTLFGEDVALTEVKEWLKSLDYDRLRNGNESREAKVLRSVIAFINQDEHLPYHVRAAEMRDDGLWFSRGDTEFRMNELSDGYRSVLSLTLELIRQLVAAFPDEDIFEQDEATGLIRVMPPGVVLIDEVDVHLHPTWQQRVGQWFTKYFPNIQFIVATHSPLVCQAAVKGTIFKLPAPGSDEQPRFVEGEERARLLYGNILDAYGTGVFGQISASPEGQKMANELAWLDAQANERPLTEDELDRRAKLRTILHTSSTDDAQAKLQSMLKLLAASLPAQREEP